MVKKFIRKKITKKDFLVMTLLARNEADIIRDNIEFHLRNGVDFIIATDNGSTDGTRKIFEEYQSKNKLILIDELGRDKSQNQWVNRMARIAYDVLGADYIFHCDADEFWCPKTGDLKSEISQYEGEALSVELINVLLENHDGYEQFPKDVKYAVVNPIIPINYEEETKEKNFYYFKNPDKVMFKTKKRLHDVTQGNHSFTTEDVTIKISKNIKIFHFPLRGKERFVDKISISGEAIKKNKKLTKAQSWHIRRWHDEFLKGNVNLEYEKLTISKAEANKLILTGMLKKFDYTEFINGKMFF